MILYMIISTRVGACMRLCVSTSRYVSVFQIVGPQLSLIIYIVYIFIKSSGNPWPVMYA
jgi:hypothetical protein